jgi:hypothetical protein
MSYINSNIFSLGLQISSDHLLSKGIDIVEVEETPCKVLTLSRNVEGHYNSLGTVFNFMAAFSEMYLDRLKGKSLTNCFFNRNVVLLASKALPQKYQAALQVLGCSYRLYEDLRLRKKDKTGALLELANIVDLTLNSCLDSSNSSYLKLRKISNMSFKLLDLAYFLKSSLDKMWGPTPRKSIDKDIELSSLAISAVFKLLAFYFTAKATIDPVVKFNYIVPLNFKLDR